MGWEVKYDMNAQSGSSLRVHNVKIRKCLPGCKQNISKNFQIGLWGPPSFLTEVPLSFLMGGTPIKTGLGYPCQDWMAVTPPPIESGWVLLPQSGLNGSTPPPIKTGYGYPLLTLDEGCPPMRLDGVLATWQLVCLLHSYRTFLFLKTCHFINVHWEINCWWLIRVTLVVDWLFLPQNFGHMAGTYH